MKPAIGFVEGADPDAISAIAGVFCPESEAFLVIHVPLEGPSSRVGYIERLRGAGPVGDGLARAVIGAFGAGLAKGCHTEFDGFIGHQRHVGKDLAQPHPGAESRRDQEAAPAQFPEPGLDGQGNAQGSVIACWD